MIIAFYPGGGGNRYLQRLLGNDWAQPDRSYDLNNQGQWFENRYLFNPIQLGAQYILTHCMNSQRIQQVFPGQPMVFIKSDFKASLQREWALHGHQRYMDRTSIDLSSRLDHYNAIKEPSWPDVSTMHEFEKLPKNILQEVNNDYAKVIIEIADTTPLSQLIKNTNNKINSAYETIKWHSSYYSEFPPDFAGAEQVIDIDIGTDDFATIMKTELHRYHSEIFDLAWGAAHE